MPNCDKCGKEASIRFTVCSEKHCEECYGPVNKMDTFKDGGFSRTTVFDAYYDRALQQYCYSYKDQEKKVKRFNEVQAGLPKHLKDKQHPDGFSFANDDSKLMAECRKAHRHKEELRESKYAGYKASQRTKYNSIDPDRGKSRRIYSIGSGK